MMRRSLPLLTLALMVLMAGPLAAGVPGSGPPATGTREALLDTLARVPASSGTLAAPLSYVDFRAVETSRPGAASPASFAELAALSETGDPSADAWFAAVRGIASGPSDLLVDLLAQGASWPASVGFDFFEVDRAIEFGSPPSDGIVLAGAFRPEAIAAAYGARGYRGRPMGDRTLWCSEDGCGSGLEVDLSQRDPSVPFGGRLGRREPLAASAGDVLSAADLGTLEDMLATASGEMPALAGHPAYRALALAPADDVVILQATLLPGGITPLPDPSHVLDSSPEEAAAIMAELTEALGPMPAAHAIGIIDGATASEQVVTIALALPAEHDAATAAQVVVQRLSAARSLARDVPYSDLLAEHGVTSVEGRGRPATADARAAAVIELRAPLAGDEPDTESGTLPPSSRLYRLLIDLVVSRDVAWMAPGPSWGGN